MAMGEQHHDDGPGADGRAELRALRNEVAALRDQVRRTDRLLELGAAAAFCWQQDRPIPVDAPRDEQIEALFDAHLLYCSTTAARAFYGRASADECVGRSLRELLQPDDTKQRAVFRAFLDADMQIRGALMRAPGPAPDQEVMSENHVVGEIVDDHLVRIWGICLDVTELMRLREAQAQTQQVELVGRLAGGVAHDFQNLLQVVLGSLHVHAEEFGTTPEIDDALDAAQRASALARRLLALPRQASRGPAVATGAFLGGLLPLLQRAGGRHVDVTLKVPEEDVGAGIDPGALEQIVMNLVVNAVDAMTDRQGTVRIGVDATENEVVLRVSDDGPGMSEATLRRVFEPFFTTKADRGGTGMGLATCARLAADAGARLEATSTAGRGTVMSLHLRRLESVPAAHMVTDEGPAPTGRERILLVEDDAMVRQLFVRVLSDAGYQVFDASDAPAALREAERHRRDLELVLTDIQLPGEIDGGTLARRLGQLLPGVPVLFVSADREAPVSGTGVLRKPCSPRHLLQAVRDALDAPAGQLTAPSVPG